MHIRVPHSFARTALACWTCCGLMGISTAQYQAPEPPERPALKPTVALGTGMLAFYGDVGNNSAKYSPLVSRIGYELRAGAPLNDWLEVGITALHGRLSVNERSLTRNLNFESRITTGGLFLAYNFHHLLRPGRPVEPYVSLGFERVEFLSKTDLLDAQGRRYHYWSDGTIRNIDEQAANAGDAVEIYRDYTYESDVRETNADGFGKYAERSFALPVGIGAKFNLGNGFDMRVGSTMRFTGTDMIDGVSAASVGNRRGDGRNDRFLYTGVSVSYAIPIARKPKHKWKPDLSDEEMDAIALLDDEDGDGVPDIRDKCPFTPPGVAVDADGCPLDGDGDGVPDHMDDELDSAPGAIVDARGVTISDEALLRAYLNFLDSGNVNIITDRVESVGGNRKRTVRKANAASEDQRFVVVLAGPGDDLSEDMIQRMLSMPDVRTMVRNDSTFYVVGDHADREAAERRSKALRDQGMNARVMSQHNGLLTDVDRSRPQGTTPPEDHADTPDYGPPVIRVQLGAYRHPLGKAVFRNVPELVEIKGADGLTRYYTGTFTDVNAAARHKVDMALNGFKGAFLVAFKDGRRVSMNEAGAQVVGVEDLKTLPVSSINKEFLRFRVQVATFAGNSDVPKEELSKGGLGEMKAVSSTNSMRYMYGDYPTRAAAEVARKELQNIGFEDAFVVGEMNGHIITAEDAEYLLGED